jgi:hypothetical protein
MAKKQCKQATLPEDAYVCIRVTADVWSEEATEESKAMLHGFSSPIDIKTGRQFRSINAASSSPQVVPARAGLPSIPFQADATPSIVHMHANHPCGTAIVVRAGERTPTCGEGAKEGRRVDGVCRRDTQAACRSPRGVPRTVAAAAIAERGAMQRYPYTCVIGAQLHAASNRAISGRWHLQTCLRQLFSSQASSCNHCRSISRTCIQPVQAGGSARLRRFLCRARKRGYNSALCRADIVDGEKGLRPMLSGGDCRGRPIRGM